MVGRNPPQPDETPLQNVRNAMALLAPIISHPDLFGPWDTRQAIEAALVRLERVVQQLDRR